MCQRSLSALEGDAATRLRCMDCLARPHLCMDCLLLSHRAMPFHKVWRWHVDDRIWETITLANLGMTLFGGRHDKPCNMTTGPPREMVFVHENGVTTMPFAFCGCPSAPGSRTLLVPEPYQLLERGFFPASWKSPRTAFTMNLMRSHHLLSLQTHCSNEDYYKYLKRTTDNISPDSVPVCCSCACLILELTAGKDRYRELNTAAREFSFLRQCKRAGVEPHGQKSDAGQLSAEANGEPENRKGLKPGSLAVLCPSCPHPGKNMRPGWETRDEKYRYVRMPRRFGAGLT